MIYPVATIYQQRESSAEKEQISSAGRIEKIDVYKAYNVWESYRNDYYN